MADNAAGQAKHDGRYYGGEDSWYVLEPSSLAAHMFTDCEMSRNSCTVRKERGRFDVVQV